MLKFVAIKLIRLYQKYLSKGLCPFTPSCSQYTIEAMEKHGFFYGGLLGAYRILRCNPFNKGRFDKVPDKRKDLKWLY